LKKQTSFFRDIKPENILIGVYGILKLGKNFFVIFIDFEIMFNFFKADFGWSAESTEANK